MRAATLATAMPSDDTYDDLWFDAYETVPDALRPILRLYGNQRRYEVLDALGEQLGLDTRHLTTAAGWQVMAGLLAPMSWAAAEGAVVLDDRSLGIVKQATERLPIAVAHRAIIEFGWGDTVVRQAKVADLADVLRGRLAANLLHHVQRALLRWAKRGLQSTG